MANDKPIKPDMIITRGSSGYTAHPDNDKLDQEFKGVQKEMLDKYHTHPTSIPHFELSNKQQVLQNYNDAQAAQLARQSKGKTWVNGLPGPVSSEPLTGGVGGGRVNWGCAAIVAVVVIAALVLIAIAGGA